MFIFSHFLLFPKILTIHQEHELGAFVFTSLIGGDTLICPVIECCHCSEVQHVVFSVVVWVRHVEACVVLRPVECVIGPSHFTSEGEVFRVYWACAVFDHH